MSPLTAVRVGGSIAAPSRTASAHLIPTPTMFVLPRWQPTSARAALDGYTILFVTSSYVVNPSLYAKVPYDPYKDFTPLTVAADTPNMLVVHPSMPAKTVKDLVDLIK